jgi:hypothetical protein
VRVYYRMKTNKWQVLILVLILAGIIIYFVQKNYVQSTSYYTASSELPGFSTNTSIKSIDLSMLLSGGPGKDGIPAINNPKLIPLSQADFDEDILGIFIEFSGIKRYYPYTILVWHEIVNDNLGSKNVAVTFCPLCGSAIVFDRDVNGKTLKFGVSGLLYESNLVMYDDRTESLWSQAKGEAIVGDLTGTRLEVLPMQLLTFGELGKKHPDAQILSTDTGYDRNYELNPYGNYEENEEILFPISVQNKKFHPKTIMYVIPYQEKSIAFENLKLKNMSQFSVDNKMITAQRNGDEIIVKDENGKRLPGYYEMWFSWATQHGNNGIVWEL